MAKIIELIYTEERTGTGRSEKDICRLCPQLWTKKGDLVVSFDPVDKENVFINLHRIFE